MFNESCSLVYVDEIPSRSELDGIYSAGFFTAGEKFAGRQSSASCLNAEQRVRQLLTLADLKRNKWLDVGCANGDFIIAAQPFVAEVCGVEISNYAAVSLIEKPHIEQLQEGWARKGRFGDG